jgi:hypothetical protein
MTEVLWSRWEGEDCIRLGGLAPGADVRVLPIGAAVIGQLPTMAGRTVPDGHDACFVPRFAFVDGTAYSVSINGVTRATLRRPRRQPPATTEVVAVYPTAQEVPRNLLRFYVYFSEPMSEGYASNHLRLVDGSGETLAGAFLPNDYELWDTAHTRLTILLDPAHIKRGLVSHRQAGYPIRTGHPFRLVVDAGFQDAHGARLRSPAERTYRVGGDARRHVAPGQWAVRSPARHSLEPLEIAFDRPLDHGLLHRCLYVVDPTGRHLIGTAEVGPAERSWRLFPSQPWTPGPHALVVDHILEDLAGNSVSRVFDQDRSQPADATRTKRPFFRTFSPR